MATTNASPRLMTAAEFANVCDDVERCELIRGELRAMAPTNYQHGKIAGTIHAWLGAHALERRFGQVLSAETGFTITHDPDTVLAPDVAFVRRDRVPPAGEQCRFAPLAPDLVVDVVSPSETSDDVDVIDKVMTHLDAGVRLVWIVHPKGRTVQVFTPDRASRTLREGDTLDRGDVLPKFRLAVADIVA